MDSSLSDYVSLELVPLAMHRSVTVPDITVSEELSKIHPEPEEKKEEPVQFGDTDGDYGDPAETSRPPAPVFTSLPRYPPSMRKAGIEGMVVVEVGIDERGSLMYGRIVRSLGREFDIAAMEWVKSIRFRPGIDRAGRVVKCRARLPIRFRLED